MHKAPLWFKVIVILLILFVTLLLVLLVTGQGHGPGRHGTSTGDVFAPAENPTAPRRVDFPTGQGGEGRSVPDGLPLVSVEGLES